MRLDKRTESEIQEITQGLLSYTTDTNADVRRFALYALRKINKPNDAVFQTYVAALKDQNPAVKREAMIGLSEAGEKGISVLITLLTHSDDTLNALAMSILKNMGPSAVPHLAKALAVPTTKEKVALLLVEIVPPPTEAKEALRKSLKDNNRNVRYLSALALTRLDAPSHEVEPVLNDALKNSQDRFDGRFAIRPAAARALEEIAPRRTALADRLWDLKHKDPSIRYRAAVHLSDAVPAPLGALTDLVKALDDPDPFVTARVVATLFNFEVSQIERVKTSVVKKIEASVQRISSMQVPGYDTFITQGFAKWNMPRISYQRVDEDIETAREIEELQLP